MKIAPRDTERFLRAPPPDVRAILLYGPDGGLARERARTLVAALAGEPPDPFRLAELSGAEIRSDPARLMDEAAAIAFTGGRRVVRLHDADDALAPVFAPVLEDGPGDALLVVEAGDLGARSALRKAFEQAPRAAAIACYRDDERALPALIREALSAAGLSATPDALAYLAANLGGDRMITRRELDKLALYMTAGPATAGSRRVEFADAQACIGDSAEVSLDDLVYALGDGDLAALDRALERSLGEGANPVAVLRAAARHLQRLHLVAGLLAQGAPLDVAMKRLRPPPFWKHAPRFRTQAQTWTPSSVGRALERLLEAERACKRTGGPAETLCAQALNLIAAEAGRRFRETGQNRR